MHHILMVGNEVKGKYLIFPNESFWHLHQYIGIFNTLINQIEFNLSTRFSEPYDMILCIFVSNLLLNYEKIVFRKRRLEIE